MANPGIFKSYKVAGLLFPYRIAAIGAGVVTQAGGANAALIGSTDELGKQSNGTADVALGGLPEVMCGAAVTAGDPLTSDDQGRAVTAQAGSRIIGFALEDGAESVIITYIHSPGYTASAPPATAPGDNSTE